MSPLLGIWPATQARALTGNQTEHPLVPRQALNPVSHTSQGPKVYFLKPYRKNNNEGKPLIREKNNVANSIR